MFTPTLLLNPGIDFTLQSNGLEFDVLSDEDICRSNTRPRLGMTLKFREQNREVRKLGMNTRI